MTRSAKSVVLSVCALLFVTLVAAACAPQPRHPAPSAGRTDASPRVASVAGPRSFGADAVWMALAPIVPPEGLEVPATTASSTPLDAAKAVGPLAYDSADTTDLFSRATGRVLTGAERDAALSAGKPQVAYVMPLCAWEATPSSAGLWAASRPTGQYGVFMRGPSSWALAAVKRVPSSTRWRYTPGLGSVTTGMQLALASAEKRASGAAFETRLLLSGQDGYPVQWALFRFADGTVMASPVFLFANADWRVGDQPIVMGGLYPISVVGEPVTYPAGALTPRS